MKKNKKEIKGDYRSKTLRFNLLDEEERQTYEFFEKIRYVQTKFVIKATQDFIADYNITPDTDYNELKLLINYYISGKKVPEGLQKRRNEKQIPLESTSETELLKRVLELQSQMLTLNNNNMLANAPIIPPSVMTQQDITPTQKVVQFEQPAEPSAQARMEEPIQHSEEKQAFPHQTIGSSVSQNNSYEDDDDDDDDDDHDMIRNMLSGFSGMLK